MRIAHVINPVAAGPGSGLAIAQPVTFESMRRAAAAARTAVVDLLAVGFPEDEGVSGPGFTRLPPLTRSALDLQTFAEPRKLPFLADIIDRGLKAASDADLLVYTNVDIAVVPVFYDAVASIAQQGRRAFSINRRTILDDVADPERLPELTAEVGAPHPGHDCFVFAPDLLTGADLGDVLVGVPHVARVLMWHLAARAPEFQALTDKHLTFHLGNDRAWAASRYADYVAHNRTAAARVRAAIDAAAPRGGHRHPLLRQPHRLGVGVAPGAQPTRSSPTRNEVERAPLPARLIMVVGPPRSGLSLVRALLGALPEAVAVAPTEVSRLVGPMLATYEADLPRVERVAGALRSGEVPGQRLVGLGAMLTRDDLAGAVRELYRVIMSRAKEAKHEAVVVIDASTTAASQLDALADVVPEATVVHVLREPVACIASMLNESGAHPGMPGRLDGAIRAWLTGVQPPGLERFDATQQVVVQHEDLLDDPVTVLKGLCAVLGLPEDGVATAAAEVVSSSGVGVAQRLAVGGQMHDVGRLVDVPAARTSGARPAPLLRDADVREILRQTTPVAASLGYTPDAVLVRRAQAAARSDRLMFALRRSARAVVNRVSRAATGLTRMGATGLGGQRR